MANKPISAIKNSVGGYDLRTEIDSGNKVRVSTGTYMNSMRYWKDVLSLAQQVVVTLENVDESYHEEELIPNN